MKKICAAFITVLIGASCGGGGGSGSPAASPSCVEKQNFFKETKQATNEVIIGDLQWQSTDQLEDAMKKSNAAATVYLSLPAKSSRCTGFLISDNMVMTNNHCVGSSSDARGAAATFGYTKSGSGEKFQCDEYVASNRALDFGIIKCKGNPGAKYPKTVLADFPPVIQDQIYITHQNCDYTSNPGCRPTQKYSEGELLGASQSNVRHNADTLPGSSGSPIFDAESHKVIAIHNAGQNYANGGGMNYGVPMSTIVEFIKDRFPEVVFSSSPDRSPAYQTCGE